MGAYSDDLLFIHIPKCAGTSVRNWLKEYVPGTTDFRDEGCDLPIGHIPLRDIERFTGRTPDSFKMIVGIIRNPYTHQLSQWLFWRDRRDKGGFHVHDVVAAMHPSLTSWLHDARCDFHVWYESQYGSSDGKEAAGWQLLRNAGGVNRYPNYGGYFRYWLEVDGEIPPNVVLIRMEELSDVWLTEVGEFAVPDAPGLPAVNLGPQAILTAQDTLPWYTPHGMDIVNDKFAWTFDNRLYNMLVPENGIRQPMGPVL